MINYMLNDTVVVSVDVRDVAMQEALWLNAGVDYRVVG